MSEKSKISVFRILSGIFLGLLSLLCLLLSIYYVFKSINAYEPFYGAVIIFLVLTFLYAPIYARLFRSMGKSFGEGVSKAVPYVKGGLFVFRLFALFILVLFLTSEFKKVVADVRLLIPARISNQEMSELVNFIRNDQRTELSNAVYQLQSQQKKIDFDLLITENFKAALDQSKKDTAPYEYGSSLLKQRLSLDLFSTIDSISAYLPGYATSNLANYIPPQEMYLLLLDYGKFYLGYEEIPEARLYFQAAATLDPENPDVILAVADIYLEKHFLAESAANYGHYCSLMKNKGMENKIPKRVTEFLESGKFGENLHKNLFECWLNDNVTDSYFHTPEYFESANIEFLNIGNRAYGRFWGNPQYVLFGPEYNYYEMDSLNFGLAGCVMKYMGREPEKMNVEAIEQLSGMKFYSDMDLPFTHINPEIITWARKNLIPDPNVVLIDKPYRSIYSIMFRDAFRQKALGYAFLNSYYDVAEKAGNYQYRMYDQGFNGLEFLSSEFQMDNLERPDIDLWTLKLEAGFWLRRRMDDTYDECWSLLTAVMKQYDGFWFERIWDGWDMDPHDPGYPADYSNEGH